MCLKGELLRSFPAPYFFFILGLYVSSFAWLTVPERTYFGYTAPPPSLTPAHPPSVNPLSVASHFSSLLPPFKPTYFWNCLCFCLWESQIECSQVKENDFGQYPLSNNFEKSLSVHLFFTHHNNCSFNPLQTWLVYYTGPRLSAVPRLTSFWMSGSQDFG